MLRRRREYPVCRADLPPDLFFSTNLLPLTKEVPLLAKSPKNRFIIDCEYEGSYSDLSTRDSIVDSLHFDSCKNTNGLPEKNPESGRLQALPATENPRMSNPSTSAKETRSLSVWQCDGNIPSCGSCRKAGVSCINDGKQEVHRS